MNSQFIPHGHCYLWQPQLLGLHILSDGLIALAYYSIPLLLFYFVQQRQDVPFKGIFVLFSLFIVAWGTTHLLAVWTIWHPVYWLSGVMKAITALISSYTAVALIPVLPQALALPDPAVLGKINQELAVQVEERQQLNQELEIRVQQRTAALQDSESLFRQLAETIREVFWMTDVDGSAILYVSPGYEVVWGRSCESLYDNPAGWIEAIYPQDRDRVAQAFFSKVSQGKFDEEYRIVRPDGEIRWIRDRGFPIHNSGGQPYRIAGLAEDISDRQAIQRMKDEFIAVVSHELRTPLTSIYGALDLLSSGLLSVQSERGQRAIAIAAENCERLVRLVNDILKLERLESSQIDLKREVVKTTALTRQAEKLIQLMADRAGIEISIVDPGFSICVDRDHIIQVLANLLNNAIKFSPRGSAVALTVELFCNHPHSQSCTQDTLPNAPPAIVFKVEDRGRGIPPDKLESIFERFRQVDASDSRRKGGTGLGLAICRSIIQQHSGQIWAESTLEKGSCFYFTVPTGSIRDAPIFPSSTLNS